MLATPIRRFFAAAAAAAVLALAGAPTAADARAGPISNVSVVAPVGPTPLLSAGERAYAESRAGRDARADVAAAAAYLRRSPTAAWIISRIESSRRTVVLVVDRSGPDLCARTLSGAAIVAWNPNAAHRFAGGGASTPALALAHELVHALHAMDSPLLAMINSNTRARGWDNLEERVTILHAENQIALELGEAVRSDHGGTSYWVPGPTLR